MVARIVRGTDHEANMPCARGGGEGPLFGYLMKLTLDGSVKETIIGSDGKIVVVEESDDEDDNEVNSPTAAGSDYKSPECPPTFNDKAIV